MSRYARFESLAASALVGIVLIVLAAIAVTPNESEPLNQVLRARGHDDDWALVLVILGAMLLYGSVRPKRKCRHIGLFGSAIMLLAIFGVMIVDWGITFSVLLLPVFGVASIGILAGDVIGHRRACDAAGG